MRAACRVSRFNPITDLLAAYDKCRGFSGQYRRTEARQIR
jgi:hypothetical protein